MGTENAAELIAKVRSGEPESSSKLQQAQEEVIRCAKFAVAMMYCAHDDEEHWAPTYCQCHKHKLSRTLDALASLSAAEGGKT